MRTSTCHFVTQEVLAIIEIRDPFQAYESMSRKKQLVTGAVHVSTIQAMLEQDRIGQAPKKLTKQGLVRMQIRVQTLYRDFDIGTKDLEEFLTGIGESIRP